MDFNSILQKIEEQKKEEDLCAKLFRYTGLIQAIEFFSQKLNFEQIIDSAFDFVNELLTLEKSAVFILQGNNYVLKRSKGSDSEIALIKNEENLQRIATLHGTLIYEAEKLERYFGKDVLDTYKVTMVIPLIIENNLYGFVFISNKTIGDLNSDDYIISEALMKLFNNALENYKRYEELQKANRELDEKIFNLFAINQSSKALLSELNLEILYNISVDVFAELMQSSITGFVLFDDKSEKYRLRAYKDVYYKKTQIQVDLTLKKLPRIDPNKIIIDVTNVSDVSYFSSIFIEGLEPLKPLNVLYLVLLIKNSKVLGFVTLGQTVTGIEYKNSMFELIESLASATYIAVSNAQLFKQVNEQKRIIQGKLERLTTLNTLMKNINSSLKVETLLDITIKTLDVSFGVEKAAIAVYDKEKMVFNISNTLNINCSKKEIKINPNWKKVLEGDTVFESTEEGVRQYICKSLLKSEENISGVLIIPIYIDKLEVETVGAIIIFKYKKSLISDEENRLTVETIANHIAPVLYNLFIIEEQKKFSLPNYVELFKADLKREIDEAAAKSEELQVVQVIDGRDFIFKSNSIVEKLKNNFLKVYPFSYNNVFIIINGREKDLDKKVRKVIGVNEVKFKTVVLGEDFKWFKDFFKLFQ